MNRTSRKRENRTTDPREYQRLVFSKNIIHQINVYRESAKVESRTEGSQVKLTPTQKVAIKKICEEFGYDISAFIRDALDSWIDLFPYKRKMERHRRLIRSILDRLS